MSDHQGPVAPNPAAGAAHAPPRALSRRELLHRSLRSAAAAACATLPFLGANCSHYIRQYSPPSLPKVLPPQATLEQIIAVINANSDRVQTYTATAVISGRQLPASLNATINFRRPTEFRLRAGTTLTGPEFDLGSNSDLFWYWIKRSEPPAMFFCRHDQFAASAARQVAPVEPQWLIDALGVVRFDPADQPQGPAPVGVGRAQIRTTPAGGHVGAGRVTIIDDSLGIVLEQHVYDGAGRRLASTVASRHVRDPQTGAVLPQRIQVEFPPTGLELTIEISRFSLNQLPAGPSAEFTKPAYPGYPDVDLADPRFAPSGIGTPPSGAFAPPPETRYEPALGTRNE